MRTPPSRRLAYFGLVLLLLVAGAAALVRMPFAEKALCDQARARLPKLLGMDVAVGACEVDPLAQTVRFRDVALTPKGERHPLVSAQAVEVSFPWYRPFLHRVTVDRVRLVHPRLRLKLGKGSGASGGGCSDVPFDELRIGRLDIDGADVDVTLPNGARVTVAGLSMGWHTHRGAEVLHVEASRGTLRRPGGQSFALGRLALEGAVSFGGSGDGPSVEISRAELQLGDADLLVSGRVEGICRPQLELDSQIYLPVRTLFRALGSSVRGTGQVWADLSVSGTPAVPRITAHLIGQKVELPPYTPGDFDAQLAYSDGRIHVRSLQTRFGKGRMRAKGEIRLASGLPTRATLRFDHAELGPVLARAGLKGAWVDLLASGKVDLEGDLSPLPRLTGEADLTVDDFHVAGRPWNVRPEAKDAILRFRHGSVHTAVRILPDRVALKADRIEVGHTRAHADVRLSYASADGLSIRGGFDALDLADTGAIAGLPWSGKGTGRFDLEGPYGAIHIGGRLSLHDLDFWDFALGVAEVKVDSEGGVLRFPDFTGQKGRTQYFGSGSLVFRHGRVLTQANVRIAKGRLEDLVDAIVGLSPMLTVVQGPLTGDATGTLTIHGPARKFDGAVSLHVNDARYYGRNLGKGDVHLRFVDGRSMVLDPSTLKGPLGQSHAEGEWAFSGPLDYRFGIDALSLEELVGAKRAKRLGMHGTLALSGTVSGDADTPVVTGTLTSPEVTFAGKKLGASRLDGRIVGRHLEVSGHPFGDSTTHATLRIRAPYPYQVTVQLALPEIRPLLPPVKIAQGLSGEVKGTLSSKGDLLHLARSSFHARVDELRLSRPDLALENDGPILLDYAGGKLSLARMRMAGPNTSVTAEGWASTKALNVKVDGSLDLRTFQPFLPFAERLSGRVSLTATAQGSLNSPSVVGNAALTEGSLRIRNRPLEIDGLSGRLEFSEARVLLDDVQGSLNGGQISMRGDVELRNFAPERIDVNAQLGQVVLQPVPDVPVTVDGEATLSGTPSHLTLGGELAVTHFVYDRPLSLEALLAGVPGTSGGGGGSAPDAPPWLFFDLGLHLKNARIDDNMARAKLLGDLRLTGDDVHPGIVGTVETSAGSQAYFRGNPFNIGQGVLQLEDRHGVDGVFDVHARTQVRDYLVRLHAFGRLSDPKVLLSSDPQLAEGDILSLLAVGVVSRDRSNTAGTSASLAAEALFNASGLGREVQRFLPKSSVLKDLSFHLATAYNDATGLVEPTAQLESKFLTDKLELTLSQPVSGRGTKAFADYHFNDGISAQVQWDDEHEDLAFGNLGLDLKLRWEIQ